MDGILSQSEEETIWHTQEFGICINAALHIIIPQIMENHGLDLWMYTLVENHALSHRYISYIVLKSVKGQILHYFLEIYL